MMDDFNMSGHWFDKHLIYFDSAEVQKAVNLQWNVQIEKIIHN